MAKQTSFAHQKNLLEQFLSLLTGFENDYRLMIQKFEEDIASLYEDQGLMEEIYEDYRATYLNSLSSTAVELQTRIQEEDIPFIEKEIDFLSSR
jgi:hypothetical protein